MNTEQNTHAGFSNIRVFSRAILLLAAFILQPSSLSHLLASDVFIAKGTNRTMNVTLTTLPPTVPFTNAVQMHSTAGGQGAYVSFADGGLANISGFQAGLAVTGNCYSAKNGAQIVASNVLGTCFLGSTNLTVFSVENITHPSAIWQYCPVCGLQPFLWDYYNGRIGVELRPSDGTVVGDLYLAVGSNVIACQSATGGDHLFELYSGYDYVRVPDTITASWMISNQTAQLVHPVEYQWPDPVAGLYIGTFDHVCTNGNGVHASHDVTINSDWEWNFPWWETFTIRIETNGPGNAIFDDPYAYDDGHALDACFQGYQPVTVTILGLTPGGGLNLTVSAGTSCSHPWDEREFAVYNVETFTLVDVDCPGNMLNDQTQDNEPASLTNTLFIAQDSNDTAKVSIALAWIPANDLPSQFRWQISPASEWSTSQGDFGTKPVTSVWEGLIEPNREFALHAWFDCDGGLDMDGDEPQRQLFVTVVNAEKLTLTDAGNTSNLVEDVTWAMEDMNSGNTLYLCESSNGTAQMQVNLDWLPATVSNGWFRWSIRQTNGADTAQWQPGMDGIFTNRPETLTWTNVAAGESNRAFRVTGWYDSDADGAIDPWEPRRRAYVVAVDTPKLTLSNAVAGISVEDLTWTNEVAGTNNTLYLAETTNGNAQMTVKFDWLPATVNSNWFRWKIALTNGAETTQWFATNAATFSTNPVTVTWTNVPASGPTNREFKVDAWFDVNTNGVQESWETHRRLFVTVIQGDADMDTDNNGTIEADDNGEDKFEEFWPGRILPVNGFGIDTNTDYLAQIKLAIRPTLSNGTARLEGLTNAACVKVWTATNKTGEVTLPATWNLSSTNPPASLYVDGIATGRVQLAFSYTAGSGNFACTDKVAMLVIPTVSWAPGRSTNAYVWASLKTNSNRNPGNNLGWADITEFENQIKDEGWPTITWIEDTTGDTDADLGSCTLANYKGLTNCGIYTVVSHGEEGGHPAVYADYSIAGAMAITNWCAGEGGISIVPWDPDPFDPDWTGGCYVARVSSSWMSSNWKPTMDGNRVVSLWSICFSATSNSVSGEGAIKECAGGRWRIGYVGPASESEAKTVNERFLKRMNGSTDNARRRTSGEAYESGNAYTPNVKMDGNDWTTLCPAPLAFNSVFPDDIVGNRVGWGCVVFDTYMCSTNAATDALIKQSGCPTSDHRWFGTADGMYGLGFDFDKTSGTGTTMRAVADKCRNDGSAGGRELDGDRVKPNKDNRDWSF